MKRALNGLLATPAGFARAILGLELYPWQSAALLALEDTTRINRVAVLSPNGAGKSTHIIAPAALWWIAVHPQGTAVITTADARQLDAQIWPAIQMHRSRFSAWEWLTREVRTPVGGRIVSFTTSESGRAEGFHKADDIRGPLLIAADEAKSVDDEIFRAFDRCTFNAMLLTSSAGLKRGRFYKAFSAGSGWDNIRVKLDDVPHISPERIADIKREHGEDSPFTRSVLYGEFMEADAEGATYLVTMNEIERADGSVLWSDSDGATVAGCDFGGGGDLNVLVVRTGARVSRILGWRDDDTMSAVGRFIREFTLAKLKPANIYADCGGLGQAMCDALKDSGWPVNRVNLGAVPERKGEFVTRAAELYYSVAQMIKHSEIVIPPHQALREQLAGRRLVYDMRGRIGLEPKPALRARGEPSPDFSDAFALCFGHRPLESYSYTSEFRATGLKAGAPKRESELERFFAENGSFA
jgi:hypothetical protein